MKTFQPILILLLFSALAFMLTSAAGKRTADELRFSVDKINPWIPVTYDQVMEAKTIGDLNHRYKPSWVSEYISVEVLTSHNGTIRSSIGKNGQLTPDQKLSMKTADATQEITIKALYIPENTLTHNDPKTHDFSFTIQPECDANFNGSDKDFNDYLTRNAIDKIPDGVFDGKNLAAVKFTVNAKGQIIRPHIFESSKNDAVDKLLLTTVQNMPNWIPAEHLNGTLVEQELVWLVGNLESCMINLL